MLSGSSSRPSARACPRSFGSRTSRCDGGCWPPGSSPALVAGAAPHPPRCAWRPLNLVALRVLPALPLPPPPRPRPLRGARCSSFKTRESRRALPDCSRRGRFEEPSQGSSFKRGSHLAARPLFLCYSAKERPTRLLLLALLALLGRGGRSGFLRLRGGLGGIQIPLGLSKLGVLGRELGLGGIQVGHRGGLSLGRSLSSGRRLGKSLFALLIFASRADEEHSTENQS